MAVMETSEIYIANKHTFKSETIRKEYTLNVTSNGL